MNDLFTESPVVASPTVPRPDGSPGDVSPQRHTVLFSLDGEGGPTPPAVSSAAFASAASGATSAVEVPAGNAPHTDDTLMPNLPQSSP